MEGPGFVCILEAEYRDHLRRQILSNKKGKSRKLTNKDKELIDHKCLLHQYLPTVQRVALPAAAPATPGNTPQEAELPIPQPSQEAPQEVAQAQDGAEGANCSPPPQ